ncbi:ribonuclease III [Methanoculleus sp. FWC-SCC1]|uniref:Ribonuclease III n=1 Tax=Methanoculleus frigidifontis TaxID=2584085 RepID=A0ABT8M9K1_9EURY|nr:ribonuclease III domain-containing protein [Methanoculleus sp. FWC-SCC1]MDN7024600.1 ribonuclease III [Methanoculleus sp. FWC-SCC1]
MKLPPICPRFRLPGMRRRPPAPAPTGAERADRLRRLLAALPFLVTDIDDAALARYDQALTHASCTSSTRYPATVARDNERLEFLGNYVLDFVVAEYLYTQYHLPPGEMNKRLQVTRNDNLADIVLRRNLGIDEAIRRRQTLTDAIIADAFEALFGAIYLDRGMETVQRIILAIFAEEIERFDTTQNFKGRLQEAAAERGLGKVEYEYRQDGPDNAPTWEARVLIAGQPRGSGTDSTKQGAAMLAAEETLRLLGGKEHAG